MKVQRHNELRQLVNAALVTSPVIAALLTTPLFLISGVVSMRLDSVLLMSISNILLLWGAHLFFLRYFPGLHWGRLLLTVILGFIISTIQVRLMHEPMGIPPERIYLIRCCITLSINGIIFIISNYILLIQTKKLLDKENDRLKFSSLEARYQLLKNQINPHFLFNSIGTAKALIRKDPNLADEYLVKLSTLLRLGFDQRPDTVTVREELSVCNDYAELQKIRFGEALRFDARIEDKYLQFIVPCFSLLTLLENAVKHNAMTEEQPLMISFRNESNQLIAENNIHQAFILESAPGTGLQNLTERYRLLFDAPVQIEKNERQFRVMVKMIPA